MSGPGLFRYLEDWDPGPFLTSLKEAGYTADRLKLVPPFLKISRSPRQMAAGRTCFPAQGSPFGTCIRLFLLGDAVPLASAMELFGWNITELTDLGLLQGVDGHVRATVQVTPIGEHLVASDFPARQLHPSGDYVMGVGPATRQLMALVPPDCRGRVLEIGCGIGYLSRRLASAGAEVTATDVNSRALEFARFNAALSGVGSVTLRQGSLFEPVNGDPPFDFIFSNPPYVQSPGGNIVFRESPEGGSVCRDLVAGIPGHLAPGGVAVVLLNWGHKEDSDWESLPLSWLAGETLQVWLNQSDCSSPEEYAWRWIESDPRFEEPAAAAAELGRWLEHYRRHSIRRLSGGFIVLRKPADDREAGWVRTDSRNIGEPAPAAGGDVRRVIDNELWLRRMDGESSVLDCRYEVPEGIQSTVTMTYSSAWKRRSIRLQSPGRLSYDGQVDETLLRLLEMSGAGKPPRALVEELRRHSSFAPGADLPERIEALTRELLRYGLLVPDETGA